MSGDAAVVLGKKNERKRATSSKKKYSPASGNRIISLEATGRTLACRGNLSEFGPVSRTPDPNTTGVFAGSLDRCFPTVSATESHNTSSKYFPLPRSNSIGLVLIRKQHEKRKCLMAASPSTVKIKHAIQRVYSRSGYH